MDQRIEASVSTDPRGSRSPSRSHAFHSQELHIVKEAGQPARVMLTLMICSDPHDGHGELPCRCVISPGFSADRRAQEDSPPESFFAPPGGLDAHRPFGGHPEGPAAAPDLVLQAPAGAGRPRTTVNPEPVPGDDQVAGTTSPEMTWTNADARRPATAGTGNWRIRPAGTVTGCWGGASTWPAGPSHVTWT